MSDKGGKIRWVAFDFDNVVSRTHHWINKVAKRLGIEDVGDVPGLLEDHWGWFTDDIPMSEVLTALNTLLPIEVTEEELHRELAWSIQPDPDVVMLAGQARKHQKTAILTDNPKERIELIKAALDNEFDLITGSAYLGKMKHDAEAFVRFCDLLRSPASEVVFIDDRLTNCEKAREAGLHAIHFDVKTDTVDQLKQDLIGYGVRF